MSLFKETVLCDLPLNFKSNVDISHLYCRSVCGVSVLYCVLRPKTKDNS